MNAAPHTHVDVELVGLLTGEAGPDERRQLLTALRDCEVCRARADELTAAMTDAIDAAPAVTPPLGFETRVAQRLTDALAANGPAIRPLAWRRRWLAAAAAVLAIAAGAVLGWRLGEGGADEPLALVRTGTDETVGTVTFAAASDGPVMIVALLDAPPDVAYRCRMQLSDGTIVDSPAWPPMARGAWVLDVPGSIDDIERIEIIADATGTVWSSARP